MRKTRYQDTVCDIEFNEHVRPGNRDRAVPTAMPDGWQRPQPPLNWCLWNITSTIPRNPDSLVIPSAQRKHETSEDHSANTDDVAKLKRQLSFTWLC